ncbi:glucokinase [Clostridium pasteurianum DSM 525 = ATCC 6013]|uniref:Glucokinase n=1 Tax=Clostridium pasteurianum DSM 525 = ATCC 6013 TaxID=1262449 RepID=A0A0H3J5H9_CLOPA|nr:ROK family protein [Clostridium pasteurianum]AJA49256.1 glucokinase [Clostridium pasteurianum DSM 525 = ATCC 6013]AJA53244.1 glucokinase [Clostridium pasteurianum DSM 525 = ATCC 6013]AOZ76434.1 glucokinase [Clostridium pasteurianum DSM 525 = ATCC 6013]AOZ80231.1 glucokinase [Clostridium pasteurianum]ELP58276.1 Rfamily protein [Clostridium pasteurianum DSM 525 = ATCC 6013]
MSKEYVIGIDLGGTKISGALSDVDGNVLSQYTISTNAFEGEEVVLKRIISVIEKVLSDGEKVPEDIKTIGIGSPGPLDAQKGIIITTPNLPFKNFKLVDPIKEKFKIPTYLDNDANVGAIGEFVFGAGQGTKNMIYITVSTGVGGGAILNGQIYRGNTCNALEMGHMTVEKDGPQCNCGNYGCVEALASGTAIGRIAKEAILRGEDTILKSYENVTSYEVFQAAKQGDAVASRILDTSLNYLGICVANMITIFDPEMVIIGGGVSKGGDIVFDKVKEVVNTRCFKAMAESCRIVPAGLGTDAGVMGAVALAVIESK